MSRWLFLGTIVLIACMAGAPQISFAQDGGRPGPGGPGGGNGQPPPPQDQMDGPGRPDRGGRPPGMGGPGMGGPGGGGPGGGGQGMPGGPNRMSPEMAQLDRMRGYIEVVDRFTRMARDPAASGVAAVIAASDMLKPRGADAAIDYFTKTLPQVKNEAVQRAIRLQLIDLYKTAGQQDKALDQMTQLMTSAPAGSTPQPMGGPGEGGPPPPPR